MTKTSTIKSSVLGFSSLGVTLLLLKGLGIQRLINRNNNHGQ